MRINSTLVFYCLISLLFSFSKQGLASRFAPYYLQQFAFTGGIGDAAIGGAQFPYCYSLGTYFRSDFNVFGLRNDYFSASDIFVRTDYYRFRSLYYGFAFVSEHAVLMPQLGVGLMKTTKLSPVPYNKPGVEFAFEGFFHTRGSGIGARLFYQSSDEFKYVGFMIQATIGWMWTGRKKSRPEEIKSKGLF